MEILTLIGLSLTLVGAGLLFIYGMPKKTIGNVIIYGETAMKLDPKPNESKIPDSEWQSVADKFQKKARSLNRTGFGLVAIGTLLQMVALL